MQITDFWARGFRSLRDVRLEGLGPFNVFYGPNGSGKSNILEAIRLLLEICAAEPHPHKPNEPCAELTKAVIERGIVQRRDLHARDDEKTIVLGARFVDGEGESQILKSGSTQLADLTIEFTVNWVLRRAPTVVCSRLESGGQPLVGVAGDSDATRRLEAIISETLPARAYSLVSATRTMGSDGTPLVAVPGPAPASGSFAPMMEDVGFGGAVPMASRDPAPHLRLANTDDVVASLARRGEIKRALLAADTGLSSLSLRRYRLLRKFLQGPPLHRPEFRPVQDPMKGADLYERLPDPNPEEVEIPIDLAGLGIRQIYEILAVALLSGARAVGIEEPEAHLYAPEGGMHLRQLLIRLVQERHIDQLFVATHSNLFDLDPTGFWEVRHADHQTIVVKKPLDGIDDHLFEPGPTLRAFEELLRVSQDQDRVMFRRPDGTAVTTREMRGLLRACDPVALEYLQDLHRAAVDVVGLRARRGVPKQ
jgi:hypothetical protein